MEKSFGFGAWEGRSFSRTLLPAYNRSVSVRTETLLNRRPMLPLAGIRVAEFCQVLAGPFAGVLLADMGADVIKVESPEGDLMRAWPPIIEGYSQYFASVNRNKRSVALDLKDAEGLARARELALSCDVVIENFRPGVMQRLGLDYAVLKATNPRIVHCSISGYGATGPMARRTLHRHPPASVAENGASRARCRPARAAAVPVDGATGSLLDVMVIMTSATGRLRGVRV